MEPEKKQDVPEMLGPWLHVSFEPPYRPTYRLIDTLAFISVGLSCGISLANLAHVRLGPHRAGILSLSAVAAIGVFQMVYFLKEQRRMQRLHDQIKRDAQILSAMPASEDPPSAPDKSRVQ